MRPTERSPFLPGWRTAQDGLVRIRRTFSSAPLAVKILLVAALVVFFPVAIPIACSLLIVGALIYAPVAIASRRRSVVASLSVATWGVVLLPFVMVAAAHAPPLARWFVPCRTVAWTLLWALPVGLVASLFHAYQPVVGSILAWLMACIVLGWRLAKS